MKELEDVLKHIIKIEVQKALHDVEQEKVFNVKEAAEYLRVSRNWLYQNLDKIPYADLGGYKFLKSDLDQYIKEKTQKNSKINIRDYKGRGCDYKVV